ncbi:FAD:protein FMN transferase, partial [bacterium]|nr:FAD:protein FMN transferase [bacterium]
GLVEIQVRARDDTAAEAARLDAALQAAFAEIARIDTLFSTHLPPRAGGEDEKLLLLREGLDVMALTGGAFDARLRPLVELWGFGAPSPRRPDPADLLRETRRLTTMPASPESLLAEPERLHYGAWAAGYAVDRAVAVLREHGIDQALVDGGGEIRCLGAGWRVGVQHPRLRGALLARLAPGEAAVSTSGDYEQYFEQDGERFHHLLDPRTGEPARGCRSVTVLAPTCARADALSTGIFVLGPERGLELVAKLPGIECLIVDAEGVERRSSGLDRYLLPD